MDDQISGTIDNIVFRNEENGFTVAKLGKRGRDQKPICIVGHFPDIHTGEIISCKGKWKHHSAHGKQFEVDTFAFSIPKDLLGIKRYLESGNIKGIGPVNAEKIVSKFGLETLDVIDNDPMRLTEIEGIGKKKVQKIVEQRSEQKSMRDVMVFLRGHNVGPALAKKIYRLYGDESIQVIQKNPYTLARDMLGVGFKTADKIAEELEIPKDSPVRVEAGLEYLLKELSEDGGHVCYPEKEFIELSEKLLGIEIPHITRAISSLESQERVIRKELTYENEPVLFIWLKSLYITERGVTKQIKRLSCTKCSIRPVDLDKAVDWVQEKHHIRLAKEQAEAIKTSLKAKLHIITGGPGTGKSTVTKAILSIHQKLSDKILLAAPTGRAAKRLSEITRHKAFTIHSLLEYDFTTYSFKKNQENPLKCDLIIIDEASMIDTYLIYSLLKAIPDEARVIFIGDIDQLPSVGPGNVLKDLIESQRIPITRLFHIFRQAKGSDITVSAHNINRGLFPVTSETNEKSDFHFIEIDSPEEILRNIEDLVSEKMPASYSFDPFMDIQVLSPMKKGVIGIENINVALQKKLNPGKESLEYQGHKFSVHDKVMQIRNNYSKLVFNGDIGIIDSIDKEESKVYVLFDHHIVEYDFTELDEIVLAYAVSVHKYQGSECPAIIMVIHPSHFKLLARNLLYTAITRGKKLVILIGTKKAVSMAIHNNDVQKRFTGLSYFIRDNLEEISLN